MKLSNDWEKTFRLEKVNGITLGEKQINYVEEKVEVTAKSNLASLSTLRKRVKLYSFVSFKGFCSF